MLVNSCSFTKIQETAAELSTQGIPVINGIDVALRAMRNLMKFRSGDKIEDCSSEIEFDSVSVENWLSRLRSDESFDEITSLSLMSDFGLPTVDFRLAKSFEQLYQSADPLGCPLVLKTAMPGIAHKSDKNGVIVDIKDRQQLEMAYRDLQTRFGDRVVIMPMIEAGVEVSVGMKNDPQYGPLVIVACGGILVEILAERAFRLAPVNSEQANAMIDQTRLSRLLSGVRGQAAVDRSALIELVVRFSQLASILDDVIAEIDLNPVIVNRSGCTIVDALVIPKPGSVS